VHHEYGRLTLATAGLLFLHLMTVLNCWANDAVETKL